MKQIIQSFKTGETILEEVPVPVLNHGSVLIRTTRSLVSLGTERMLVEFGKSSLIAKAVSQPDRVKQVLDKISTDGLVPALEAAFNKLGQPLPLGYCNVGRVIAIGEGVTEFLIGDRVASNGPHAEFVNVKKNLVTKVPENVSDEEAAFTVIGSIGLQGIRLCNATMDETIVVTGLGLIGLLTVQLLLANGCRVIGIDIDKDKCSLARSWGANTINLSMGEDPVNCVSEITKGVGADGVIITASSKSDDLISQSAKMCRKRGRIILVGVIGLNLNRAEFYEKELTFQVSCSYGPGRYDENYEQKGIDYPVGYVRWTEKRNFEAILNLISTGRLFVKELITDRIKLDNFLEIYGDMGRKGSIASIIEYCENAEISNTVPVLPKLVNRNPGKAFAIIGAGNFASATIVPSLRKIKAQVKYISSANGLTAKILAKKGRIANATSDYNKILSDDEVGVIIIATRHNLHSKLCIDSLNAGKHVFVEKPLALRMSELEQIIAKYNESNGTLVVQVGFNRRFAPLAIKMKDLMGGGPKNIIATMNAGFIPGKSWVQDLEVGGGRIIGEACHHIDLAGYLAGSKITSVCMNALGINPEANTDNASILLKFENGSNAVINYFSNGSKKYSKERIEVYSHERTLIMDNWRELKGYGIKGFSKMKIRQDKGHLRQFSLLNDFLENGGEAPINFDEIVNSTKASFAAIESFKTGAWVKID